MTNLMLPGNPRYQPKKLWREFGYDNLYRTVGEVELANLQTMAEVGLVPAEVVARLTPEIEAKVLNLTTTQIEETERAITKHDIRAWVVNAAKLVPPEIAPLLHVMLTSYDPLDTGRILQFSRAHRFVVRPTTQRLIKVMSGLVRKYASQLQIGRTHGQHALPITVGFWLATVLNRIIYNFQKMELHESELVGKISGAVGAYNAQIGLGAQSATQVGGQTYEERLLAKLGLKPARISTQILAPEPLAYYLHSGCMLSASLAQLGLDCRQLMRSEIAEIAEEFAVGQGGSSTIAHKRNPISWENLQAMWIRTKSEFGKVLDTLLSEHQRDLVGSAVARDFPIILINLVTQLDTLLRENTAGVPFLERMSVNGESCARNFQMNAHLILSEPLYIAIQMAGYTQDGHELVNHTLVPRAQKSGRLLVEVAADYALENEQFGEIWRQIPSEVISLLHHPEQYTGLATQKALQIADFADMTASS